MKLPTEENQRIAELRADIERRLMEGRAQLSKAEATDRFFMALRLSTFGLFFAFFLSAAFTQDNQVALGIIPSIALFFVVLRVHKPRRQALRSLQRRQGLLAERVERIGVSTRARRSRRGSEQVGVMFQDMRRSERRPEGTVLEELGILDSKRGLLGLADITQTALGAWAVEERLAGAVREAQAIADDQDAIQELLADRSMRLSLEETYCRCALSSEHAAASFLNAELPSSDTAARISLVLPFTVGTIVLAFASVEFQSLLLAIGATLWAGIGNYVHRRGMAATALIRNGTAECMNYLCLLADVRSELDEKQPNALILTQTQTTLTALYNDPRQSPDRAMALLARLGIYRAGLFYVFFNFLTLYDLYFTRPLIEYWQESRKSVQEALQAVAELESLTALANMAEEQVGYMFPSVTDESSPFLQLTDARHPVLDVDEAVEMSISLQGDTRTYVVTGANMSGKSTLIRTLGAAVILGSAGGAIPASSSRMTPLLLCSDINVTDSLQDGESTFGAEAKRVAAIAQTIAERKHTLVLLDEVFRGTNTHEKVAAGRAFVEWISAQGGLAVAATHDHELTTLADDKGSGICNVHFNADCQDGQLIFDYKLREGPAPGTNALAVLAAAGLPREVVDNALRQLPASQQIRTKHDTT